VRLDKGIPNASRDFAPFGHELGTSLSGFHKLYIKPHISLPSHLDVEPASSLTRHTVDQNFTCCSHFPCPLVKKVGEAMAADCTSTLKELPIYEVHSAGVDESLARKLADALKIPGDKLLVQDGVASFHDPSTTLLSPA
jgi:hypothetical protein